MGMKLQCLCRLGRLGRCRCRCRGGSLEDVESVDVSNKGIVSNVWEEARVQEVVLHAQTRDKGISLSGRILLAICLRGFPTPKTTQPRDGSWASQKIISRRTWSRSTRVRVMGARTTGKRERLACASANGTYRCAGGRAEMRISARVRDSGIGSRDGRDLSRFRLGNRNLACASGRRAGLRHGRRDRAAARAV